MYQRVAGRPLRLLFVGRIEDQSKGVFWLPAILRDLSDATLTVVGSGPDEAALRRMLAPFGTRVFFHGALPAESVRAMYADHDVLVGPSRYEGFMIVLVEAMSKGCVPVASRIRGVTDTIVEHGRNGFLFPVGDTALAAQSIASLSDPATFDRISASAIDTVAKRFGIGDMAQRYQDLLDGVMSDPPPLAPARDLSNWRMESGLRSGLRTFVPLPVKNFLRTYRERAAT
jgi:glycosyltransferase involved in cell wall biosynthesis